MRQIVACASLFILLLPTFLLGSESLIIFSGDLRGEIKPCGCAEESDMGGLPRRNTFFKNKKSIYSNLLYLDLGNNFPEPSEQGDLKIKLIQTSLKKLIPKAVLVGPNEWLNGLHWLDPKIPYLLSNQGENLDYLESETIRIEEKIITIFGFLSPSLVYQNKNDLPLVLDVNEKLISDWKKKLQTKFIGLKILLFRGNKVELQQFDDASLFDLIVVGSNNNDELRQVLKMETKTGIFPMIPTKGQGILTAKLNKNVELVHENYEAVPAGLTITWLRRNFEDSKDLDLVFKEYNDSVKELFFSNLNRMEKQKKESPFVGNLVCSGCHQNSSKIWKESRHSHAFLTLEKKKKHFDPECLECHVVGLKPWQPPKDSSIIDKQYKGVIGFLSQQITPHLRDVQCENCHGPARAHLRDSKIHPPVKNPSSTCVICHHGSHSPMFDFETYWQKIKH